MLAASRLSETGGRDAQARDGVIVRNVQNVTVIAREAASSKAFQFRFN